MRFLNDQLVIKEYVKNQQIENKMISRLYLITYFFRIILIFHIESKEITFGPIDDALLSNDEFEKKSDLETTQSADKLFGEGRCKNIFFRIQFNNTITV